MTEQASCKLDELARIIASVPPAERPSVVRMALDFTPSDSFEHGYFVGVIRAGIANVLERHFETEWFHRWKQITRSPQLSNQIECLAAANSVTAMKQQLSEILLSPERRLDA